MVNEIIITLKRKRDDHLPSPQNPLWSKGIIAGPRKYDYLPRRRKSEPDEPGGPGEPGDVVSLPPRIVFDSFNPPQHGSSYEPKSAYFNILPNEACNRTITKRIVEYSHFADFVQPDDIVRKFQKDCTDCEFYEVGEFTPGLPSAYRYTTTFQYPRGGLGSYDILYGFNLNQPLLFIVNRYNPSNWYYKWTQADEPSPGELFFPNTTVYIRARDFYEDADDWSDWTITSITMTGGYYP